MPKTLIILLILILTSLLLAVQEERHAENPEIPQLKEMHHFIRPMWHDAYPDKDITQLKELYPDLTAHYDSLKNAVFPEKWADRKLHWQEGISAMGSTLEEYQQAMTAGEDEKLLAAARQLHDDFERLVRIVNPPIPEMDDFHKTLFYVYHDYLPAGNWIQVKASIPEFQEKAAVLRELSLPDWMSDNEKAFQSATGELKNAVDQLAELKDSEDEEKLAAAVEKVHEAYVKLEELME